MWAVKGLAHDLDTSVWSLGKDCRLRVGGDRLASRKLSSSLLVCGSAWSSAGQFIFYLAKARVITSNSSSCQGDWGGGASVLSYSPSSEDEDEAPSPRPGGKWLPSGLPIPGSGRRIWWVRKAIGTRPSPFPPTDPTTNPTSADARTSTARNAGEDSSVIKESLSSRPRTQACTTRCSRPWTVSEISSTLYAFGLWVSQTTPNKTPNSE